MIFFTYFGFFFIFIKRKTFFFYIMLIIKLLNVTLFFIQFLRIVLSISKHIFLFIINYF